MLERGAGLLERPSGTTDGLIAPAGWKIGLVRVEDVAIGCAVSLFVGLLFWPRGARAAMRRAMAQAYRADLDWRTGVSAEAFLAVFGQC